MRSGTTAKPRRRWVLLLAIAAAAAPLAPAAAQGELNAALRAFECTRIDDDRERLRCYDAALRAPARTDGGSPATPERREPATAGAPAPARAAERQAPRADPAPAAAARAEPSPAPAAVRTVEVPAARTSTADRSDGARDDRTAEERVVVVQIRRDFSANATFTTSDGEILRQTDGRRTQFEEPPFSAVLRPGALGSFFLVPDGRRAVRVRRER